MSKAPAILCLFAFGIGAAAADQLDIAAGRALFERRWITAPASAGAADGLGPLFNAKSCGGCHQNGGAARFLLRDGKTLARGLVVRLASADGSPHPRLGHQLQDRAVAGLEPEGRIVASLTGDFLDVVVELFDAEPDQVLKEIRIAPSLRGRGMIERINDDVIAALADPDDRDGDGISGRVRLARDVAGRTAIGRFGHKASSPSIESQTSDAAAIDLGLSSQQRALPYGDCTPSQTRCWSMAQGREPELPAEAVSLISEFVRSLDVAALPPATAPDLALFASTGCAACHRPDMPDRSGNRLPVFTDLLLHDLGPEAAGVIAEDGFSPSEWRTAPLVDLDPMEGQRRYMHDGRAASLHDAVMRHGGEARRARSTYTALSEADRRRLVAFLAGL